MSSCSRLPSRRGWWQDLHSGHQETLHSAKHTVVCLGWCWGVIHQSLLRDGDKPGICLGYGLTATPGVLVESWQRHAVRMLPMNEWMNFPSHSMRPDVINLLLPHIGPAHTRRRTQELSSEPPLRLFNIWKTYEGVASVGSGDGCSECRQWWWVQRVQEVVRAGSVEVVVRAGRGEGGSKGLVTWQCVVDVVWSWPLNCLHPPTHPPFLLHQN